MAENSYMKKIQLSIVLTALLLLVSFLPVYGEDFPDITPSDAARKLALEDVPLSIKELSSYGLILSGSDPQDLSPYMSRLDSIIAQLKRSLQAEENGDEQPLGDRVLAFMHETVTRVYREEQTRLDVLLDTGVYNCVSSSLLYTILARSVGLSVGTINTPDHVFCTVETDEGPIDVETTNSFGYKPGEKKQFFDKFGRTGYTYVPPGNYRLRTETDDRGLLSFVLQNRIAALERTRDYHRAVELAVDRYTILKDEEAEKALVKEFTNYAALLNQKTQYDRAFDFLELITELYGNRNKYRDLANILVNNKVTTFIRQNDFSHAKSFVQKKLSDDFIETTDAEQYLYKIEDQRVYTEINRLPFGEAISVLKKSYSQNKLPQERFEEYSVFLYLKKARNTVEEEGWLAGLDIIEEAEELVGKSRKLSEAAGVFRHNYAADIHNRFAQLYNSGSYEQAEKLLSNGLEQVPGNSILLKDKRILERTDY